MNDYDIHTFSNGIRLIHKQVVGTKIAHCGFIMDIGSRDERLEQQGIAHFWEHMAFKGTVKRKAFHIINRLEAVGGDLNAYTTKEKICFYASLLDEHFEKAVELLSDITFNSTFPEKEIVKERGVILEEMSMYEDDPADAIQDDFDELVFGLHPLGRNILGSRESVGSFGKPHFEQFLHENLDTERLVFASVSALPFNKVKKLVERYVSEVPHKRIVRVREPFGAYTPNKREVIKPITQAHCIVGVPAYALDDPRRISFSMLTNILGGNGMNSRLNMAIRERNGLAYSVYANYTAFVDTGLFSIQFATEEDTLKRCIDLTMKELSKMRESPMGKVQLHTAKQQFMGQMAMAEEGNLNLMLVLGKSLLDLGYVESLSTLFAQIEALTAQELLDMSNDLLSEPQLSTLIYMPEEEE
jgi:predicted Zn-dependent peptidase